MCVCFVHGTPHTFALYSLSRHVRNWKSQNAWLCSSYLSRIAFFASVIDSNRSVCDIPIFVVYVFLQQITLLINERNVFDNWIDKTLFTMLSYCALIELTHILLSKGDHGVHVEWQRTLDTRPLFHFSFNNKNEKRWKKITISKKSCR